MNGEAKLFIASPSYTATYCSGYVESLVDSIKDLKDHGIKTIYKSLDGLHWIDIARDVLSHVFLHTDCTHMLQIDSDLAWDVDAPRKLLERDADIIGGTYRIKSDIAELYTISRDSDGTVRGLPGGFIMVKREVIERLAKGVPNYSVSTLQFGQLVVAPLWTREMNTGGYVGEDFAFCNRAVAAGYTLEVYEDLNFKHFGTKAFEGNYSRRQ
jgi:hypothetical protein